MILQHLLFIESLQYAYIKMHEIHWVPTNKMKYNKSKVCEDIGNTNVNI